MSGTADRRTTVVCALVLGALAVVCLADLALGGTGVGLREFVRNFSGQDGVNDVIIWKLRFPRMLTAMVCGSSLALGGALMQSIFRNPLADPHVMGISSGAGLGAALCSSVALPAGMSALSGMGIMLSAFAGAAVCSALVLAVSGIVRKPSTLLLFGVMMGFVLSSLTSLTEYFAPEQSLKVFYSWSCGSFSSAGMSQVWTLAVLLLAGVAVSLTITRGLDIALFGDEYARLCGANPKRTRLVALLCCCLLTGGVTAVCGPVGFVGIVSAHVARKTLGTSSHSKVIPVSMLVGAVFAVAADFLSQVWPSPLPAGSVLALVGAPVVLYVLFTEKH